MKLERLNPRVAIQDIVKKYGDEDFGDGAAHQGLKDVIELTTTNKSNHQQVGRAFDQWIGAFEAEFGPWNNIVFGEEQVINLLVQAGIDPDVADQAVPWLQSWAKHIDEIDRSYD